MPHPPNRRMPLSCEPCRERKIRCPRRANQGRGPCETCVRRGIPPSECVYLRDLYGRRDGSTPRRENAASLGGGNAELLQRIDKLEKMMQSQVQSGRQSTSIQASLPSPDSVLQSSIAGFDRPASSPQTSRGRLMFSKSGHVRYVQSASALSADLRGLAGTQDLGAELDDCFVADEFPLSATTKSREELMASLPPLAQCNQLKDIYLNVFAPLFHILHDKVLEMDYSRFISDPDSVPLSWLALLYAIFSVAVIAIPDTDEALLHDLGHRKTATENMSLLFQRYRRAAMQCLEADHYLWRHNLHTLQTLILLIYGINQTHGQSWALLGTARNIALAIGCHVDPDAFNMDICAAEERRRAWAGLNTLHTVQNTTMGHLDIAPTSSDVKLPLDLDDVQIADAVRIPPISPSKPSQMSYLILKFQLYETCSAICKGVFGNASTLVYSTIRELDAEIISKQESLNCKYLIDTTHEPLPDYHAAHLNILFGYTHQLALLLHRPILMRTANSQYQEAGWTQDEWELSRNRCLDSSRALLGIHKMLHEDEVYRRYSWYNRGLGSFHAFHAVVCLAYILTSNDDQSTSFNDGIRQDIESALVMFDQIERTGLSAVAKRATPVIRKILAFLNNISVADSRSFGTPGTSIPSQFGQTDNGELYADTGHGMGTDDFQVVMENLGSQPWLSPSSINWLDWETALDIGRAPAVF